MTFHLRAQECREQSQSWRIQTKGNGVQYLEACSLIPEQTEWPGQWSSRSSAGRAGQGLPGQSWKTANKQFWVAEGAQRVYTECLQGACLRLLLHLLISNPCHKSIKRWHSPNPKSERSTSELGAPILQIWVSPILRALFPFWWDRAEFCAHPKTIFSSFLHSTVWSAFDLPSSQWCLALSMCSLNADFCTGTI